VCRVPEVGAASGCRKPRTGRTSGTGPGGQAIRKLTAQFEAFRGTLGIRFIQCRPAVPEAKGLVERANGYLETSFLPGRIFTSPADFNGQFEQWLVRARLSAGRASPTRR